LSAPAGPTRRERSGKARRARAERDAPAATRSALRRLGKRLGG
jgi:hypothetical protein